MVRNIIFMVVGAVIGAGVIYAIPTTCDVVIDQTGNLLDMGRGLIQGASE